MKKKMQASASLITLMTMVITQYSNISALKLRKFGVPGAVSAGSSVWLHCDFDLEGDALYSVKWYKNNEEFYRYKIESPLQKPEHKVFKQSGIYIDLEKSNTTHVWLLKTDLNTEGTFGCEVSIDAPTYITVKAEKDLRIYVLPQKALRIKSKLNAYENGDIINVTCISGPSKPPPFLFWYINGKRLSWRESSVNLSTITTESNDDGLITSSLSLEFRLFSEKHFENGALTVSCTSLISQTYCITYTELVVEERGRRSQMTEYEFDEKYCEPPKINGHINSYSIGDQLDVNCSTIATRPVPFLQWFINEQSATSNESIVYSHEEMYDEQFKSFASLYDSYPTTNDEYPLIIVVGLRLILTKDHFQTQDGTLTLRCTSIHPKIIQTERQEFVLLRDGRQTSNLMASQASMAIITGPIRVMFIFAAIIAMVNTFVY